MREQKGETEATLTKAGVWQQIRKFLPQHQAFTKNRFWLDSTRKPVHVFIVIVLLQLALSRSYQTEVGNNSNAFSRVISFTL